MSGIGVPEGCNGVVEAGSGYHLPRVSYKVNTMYLILRIVL
jgi:hypothetical protein